MNIVVEAASATYRPRSDFHREVQAAVAEHFARTGKHERGDWRMHLKTVVILTWLVLSYVALVFWASTPWVSVGLAVSLGLAMAGVGFNIQHDGGHGAYSQRPWVNRAMALTLDLLGGTAYFWHYKHNIAHHTHPNVAEHDDDINVGVLGRMSPHQRWYAPHRFQHFYMWGLYALLAVEWQLTGEFRNLITKSRYGRTHVPRPRGGQLVVFWLGKVIFFGLAFGLPLALHSPAAVLALYLVASGTLGLVLAVVFQIAHCSLEANFTALETGERQVPRSWAEHQVLSTVNFAPGSHLANWYLGGLNYQIEHHLFPRVCHVHYPALAGIVREVCRRHRVPYFAHPTMLGAVASHARFLRAMGRSPGGSVTARN